MLLIYTGPGKGKTSACVGQAVRALGRGFRVAFGQFMKRPDQAGEQEMLARLLGENFLASGAGFYRDRADYALHRRKALELLDWAGERIDAGLDMLVLDECLYALGAGLILREEVECLLALARRQGRHLVLSGRGVPDWLADAADLVTSMTEIKHPWRSGIAASPGIEY